MDSVPWHGRTSFGTTTTLWAGSPGSGFVARSDALGTLDTMPATRLMPTEEGQDLIDLTREICDKELRPKVDDAERAAATDESFPTRGVPHAGGGGPALAAPPRGVRRLRPALRGVPPGRRGDRLGLDERGRGRLGALADRLPGHDLRHARAAGGAAARHALRRPARRVLPVRAARRLRRRLDDDPRVGEGGSDGEPTAYRLRGRKAWISHAGHADYYTTFARTSDDGGRGLSCFVVPADASGHLVRHPREEDGAALRHRARGDVRRRAGRRLPADRRRGPGHGDRALRAGCRSARDRRCRNGSGPVRARPRHVVREGAPAVRPADRGQPGARVPRRRHGGGRHQRPGDLPARGPPEGCRPRVLEGGRGRQAGRHRRRDAGHDGCRAGARRRRLHPGLPGRAVTCARRR